MRPITKLFLLLVAAFFVYLVWPRTPNFKNFDPAKLAALQIENWRAIRDNEGTAGLIARYKINTSQYHFSPIGAFRMSQNQGTALEHLRRVHADKEDSAAEIKATSALTEKYAIMRSEAKQMAEPDVLAREEEGWFLYLLDGAPAAQVAEPLTRILAARYGGLPGDFEEVATSLAQAQIMIFSHQERDASSGMTALDHTREAYTLLKEIAATPVAQPEPTATQ